MNKKANFAMRLCLFILGNMILGTQAVLKTIFMDDLCFSKPRAIIDLRQENFGILTHRPRCDNSEFKCQVTVVSPEKSFIVLSIYRYDFSDDEHLTIKDSDGFTMKLIGSGIFKDEKKSFTSSEKMIISYTKRNTSSTCRGFQFTFTRVHDSPCYENEFQCKNGKCILKELACNRHNHCGDNSDQIKCVPETPGNNNKPEVRAIKDKFSMPIILLSVLAVMLLVITISFIMVILKFAHNEKTSPAENSEMNEPRASNSLQSFASTAPHQNMQPSAERTQEVISDRPQTETLYNRLRRSFRGRNTNREIEVPVHQETYQVPSMYPNLDLTPSAPELNGVENQNFKSEE